MFHPRRFFRKVGPGVITGASDDDPSGIVTYSQTGAKYGYQLLWLSLFTTPLMLSVQELSGRLGLVTKRGLAELIKKHYSRRTAMVIAFALLIANVVNIGADLSAMAAVTKLLIHGSEILYIFGFAVLIVVLEVAISYARYANILKWLALALLTYVAAAFATHQNWPAVIGATFVPHIPHGAGTWMLITGILGTTITPYCFFWQASEEVEERNLITRLKEKIQPSIAQRLQQLRVDTATGMIYSNVVMFFIIVTTAGTLHQAGMTNITTAEQAANALRPLAGNLTFFLFALGLIGIGLLAVPILAGSAAYALAEVFSWPEGLAKRFRDAKAFYITIAASIGVGAILTAGGLSPITFLLVAAVVNGVVAPLIIWFMLRLANSRDVVGEHRSPRIINMLGWVTFCAMTISALMMVVQYLWK